MGNVGNVWKLGESEGVEEIWFSTFLLIKKYWLIDMFLYFLINVHAQIKKEITKSDWSHKMIEWKLAWRPYQMLNVELETCTEIFSVYPRLFEVFFSSFLSLPECPKYKPSITLLSCSFYARIKLDFCEDILGNQSNYCDWYFLMYNLYFWCIMMWNHMSMIDQKKKMVCF